jgi:hypothetical protein
MSLAFLVHKTSCLRNLKGPMTRIGFFNILGQQNFLGPNLLRGVIALSFKIRCMVNTTIKGKDKLFSLKLDILQMHVRWEKTIVVLLILLSGTSILTKILHMPKTRGFMLANALNFM